MVPEARTNLTNKVFNIAPGPAGGHAWQSMSYSPITKLVYIPATTHWQLMGPTDARPEVSRRQSRHQDGLHRAASTAWDPVAQREVWRSEEFINPAGGVQVTGGALATAGNLVFHGNLPKQEFVAYRATDGKRLWSFGTKTAVLAGAISYEVGREQYVAIAVGGPVPGGYYAPNGARLLVFKLGGKTVLPDLPQFTEQPIAPPPQFADAATIRRGARGVRGAMPDVPWPQWRCALDLSRTCAAHRRCIARPCWMPSCCRARLSEKGMASFRDYLKDGDTVALRAYLISVAEAARSQPTVR